MTRCKHENADHLKSGDFYDDAAEACFGPYEAKCEQFRCLDCGEWLSFGPANDSTPTVQFEIRAAELAHEDCCVSLFSDHEWLGWTQDEEYICDGAMLNVHDELSEMEYRCWHAGYLARCIAMHDSGADGDCEELESRARRGAEE